ncbi:AAA domain-containing protein [Jimgerdemannia flammicorona]|uniref:AAA domain-containing protein n=1 Tax=Jimgerdemannia flammicorona TaxID=994334 RepID=A0A433QAJ9_9FUNG|nr:AAA domain-containing protein [Jimgerdemannia flammicorona]
MVRKPYLFCNDTFDFIRADNLNRTQQLGPILQNDYPVLPDDQPLLFGSIQQCLMRKANGRVLGNDTFFLRKGHKHDFGPCTIQLKDNWRMNDELNLFFQQIYGTDFIARFPNLKLNYTASGTANVLVNRILDPDHAITLVKLRFLGSHTPSAHHLLQTEAQVVAPIVRAYIKNLPVRTARKPPVFIVTPHHRQRVAVSSQLFPDLNDLVTVNTVEKMQGQEAELVIACFTFLSIKDQVSVDFLLDFHRWNVAVSRARCKVIIVTTEAMLVPKGMDMFRKKTTAEGWGFVWLLERWAKERESVVEWGVQ